MLIHNADITGSLTINGIPFNSGSFSGSFRGDGSQLTGITGATTASYVEYSNVGNKPALVSGSEQISFNGIVDKPTLVSGSAQITYSELSNIPVGIVSGSTQISFNGITDKPALVSGSSQITYSGLSGIPSGIVSGSSQVSFNGIVDKPTLVSGSSQVTYGGLSGIPTGIVSGSSQVSFNGIVDKPTLVSGSAQISYPDLSNIPNGIVSSSTQITGYNIFATTGSNTFNGTQTITGSIFGSGNLTIDGCITATGQIVAQTINVQQVTSSIVYSCGSNIFGTSLANTQQFTGSMLITGSNITANVGTACFQGSVCAPAMDIMPSGIGSSTLGGIMRIVTTGTSTGIAVGQSNTNRYTHIAANDIQVFNDDFFLSTRCAFPLSIGTCYTARLTFTATGIACFACQVCAPVAIFTGCVGIGTTSPATLVQAVNDSNNSATFSSRWNASGFWSQLEIRNYSSNLNTQDSPQFRIMHNFNDGVDNGYIGFHRGSDLNGGFLSFGSSGTERLRISSTGIACFACQVCAPCVLTNSTILGSVNGPANNILRIYRGGGASNYSEITNIGGTTYVRANGITGVAASLELQTKQDDWADFCSRLTIVGNGIACFACQVCAPVAIFSGCVGIGITTPPARPLHIAASCGTAYTTSSSGNMLLIANTCAVANSYAGIELATEPAAGNASAAAISVISTGSGNGDLAFTTRGSSVFGERMRITAGGNVGIGTTDPNIHGLSFTKQVTISNTSSSQYANLTVAGGSGASGGIDFGNQSVRHAGVYGLDGSNLGFYTNNCNSGNGLSERMRITSTGIACFACQVCAPAAIFSGCVGIGTTSPAYQFDLTGNDNGPLSTYLRVYSNNRTVFTGIGYQRLETNGDLAIVAGATQTFRTGGTDRMHITSTGEACFACQVCAPNFKFGSAGNIQSCVFSIGASTEKTVTICTDGGGSLNGTAIIAVGLFVNGAGTSSTASWTVGGFIGSGMAIVETARSVNLYACIGSLSNPSSCLAFKVGNCFGSNSMDISVMVISANANQSALKIY